jgi:hypothetical protein
LARLVRVYFLLLDDRVEGFRAPEKVEYSV